MNLQFHMLTLIQYNKFDHLKMVKLVENEFSLFISIIEGKGKINRETVVKRVRILVLANVSSLDFETQIQFILAQP